MSKAMKKITVMIAEDEPPTLRFVKKIVEEIPGFSVCGACLSAEEGLSRLTQECPDILITDIRMPGMSGLELIRRAREMNRELYAIVISGYKLFEYAKEAIELETTAYILKPIHLEEMRAILESIRDACEKRHIKKSQGLLQAAFRGRNEAAFYQALPSRDIRLLAVYCGNAPEEIYLLGADVSEDVYGIVYKNWTFFLQRAEDADSLHAISQKILTMPNRRQTCTCVWVSHIHSNGSMIEALRGLYSDTLRYMTVPGKTVKAVFAQPPVRGDEYFVLDADLRDKLSIDISAYDMKHFKMHFFELFARWEQCQVAVAHIRSYMHELASLFIKHGVQKTERIDFNEVLDEIIWRGDSFAEIRDNLWAEIEESVWREKAYGDESPDQNEQKLFDQICGLIKKTPEQNIPLGAICDRFHVSQPYVQKIFRIYTGKTYKAYQVEWKIQLARSLMDGNPSLRVWQVAEKIGFEPLYFGTVFSKYTGMTPTEYKARQQVDKEQK